MAIELNGANGTNGDGTNGNKKNHARTLSRKMSSPMMPAFMVSAPAKVILFGEHAVVHGKVSSTETQGTSRLPVARPSLTLYSPARLPLLQPYLSAPTCSSPPCPSRSAPCR